MFSIQQLLVVFKSFFIFVRFCLEEPPGLQRMYNRASTPPPTKVTCLSDKEQKDWVKDVQGITEQWGEKSVPKYLSSFFLLITSFIFYFCSFLKRKGIVVNETAVLLYGQLLTGRKYVPKANGIVEIEKQWAKQVLPFAYQTVVKVPANSQNRNK